MLAVKDSGCMKARQHVPIFIMDSVTQLTPRCRQASCVVMYQRTKQTVDRGWMIILIFIPNNVSLIIGRHDACCGMGLGLEAGNGGWGVKRGFGEVGCISYAV